MGIHNKLNELFTIFEQQRQSNQHRFIFKHPYHAFFVHTSCIFMSAAILFCNTLHHEWPAANCWTTETHQVFVKIATKFRKLHLVIASWHIVCVWAPMRPLLFCAHVCARACECANTRCHCSCVCCYPPMAMYALNLYTGTFISACTAALIHSHIFGQ